VLLSILIAVHKHCSSVDCRWIKWAPKPFNCCQGSVIGYCWEFYTSDFMNSVWLCCQGLLIWIQHKLDLSSIVLAVPGPLIPSLYNGMPIVVLFLFVVGGEVSLYLFNYISNIHTLVVTIPLVIQSSKAQLWDCYQNEKLWKQNSNYYTLWTQRFTL